jgi:signal transduction histidine kinase/CheY-like chemotaxis protein
VSNKRARQSTAPSRSLVDRLTRTFLLWILIAYVASLTGLWWSAHYVVEFTLKKEAQRLVTEFDELGTPLFLAEQSSAMERIRKHAAQNADILYIRYYLASDNKVLGQYLKTDDVKVPDFAPGQIPALSRGASPIPIVIASRRFVVVTSVRGMAPIRTHSTNADQLLDLSSLSDRQGEQALTIGYLDIGMDVAPSRAVIVKALLIVAGLSALMLMMAVFLGRRHVRTSLDSLLRLQEPLRQLAAGNFKVMVEHSGGDLEIASVCEALNATIAALRQREAEKEAALRAKLEAEAASEAKSAFLAHMSHEIRTPLNGVMGFLKLLSKTALTATQRDYLRTIEVSAKTLLTVINDILDFSKIEAGMISIEQIDIEFRELLEEVISLHAANAEERGLDLVFVFSRAVPVHLMGDPARISQVLSNLVGNAIKFTQRGEVLVMVELKEETEQNVMVEISVKDSGIGISEEARERLFQSFSQADASTTRKYGGTGLGLIISKRLVELMGGNIGLASAAGDGTRFTLTLSLIKQRMPAIPSQRLGEIMAGLHILTVTPSVMVARSLAENLESWGIAADNAGSANVALDALENAADNMRPYGAVVFDNAVRDMMPNEFLERSKDLHRVGKKPIILLGGLSGGAHSGVSRSVGFSSIVSKPVRSSELYNELSRIFIGTKEVVVDAMPRRIQLQSAETGGALRALVVDDNEINRKLAILLVEELGGSCDSAGDGAQAVEACRRSDYDLVLMDIHMPVMDGVEATALIREIEGTRRHTLIIALTANAMSGDRERYLTVGMDDYLGKPINEKTFTSTLQKFGLTIDATVPDTPPLPAAQPGIDSIPAPADDHSPLPVLDPQMGLKLAFGDRELWRTILAMLFQQMAEDAVKLAAERAVWNPESLQHVAHKLAGASSYCGTPALYRAAKHVESLAKSGDRDASLKGIDALLLQIARLQALSVDGVVPDGEEPIF